MNNEQWKDFINNPDTKFSEDDCYYHFDNDSNSLYWVDIAKEGDRIASMMSESEVEEGSNLSCLISAISAAAAHGIFETIAKILGVDKAAIESICDEQNFYFDRSVKSQPLGFKGFERFIKETNEEIKERDKEND